MGIRAYALVATILQWFLHSLALQVPQSQVHGGLSDLLSRRSRSLANAQASSSRQGDSLYIVNTPQEFRAALHSGAVHIELRNHLDLSGLWYTYPDSRGGAAFNIPPTLQSLRGNCPEASFQNTTFRESLSIAPSDPALEPQKPGQCVVTFDHQTDAWNTEASFWPWPEDCTIFGPDREELWLDSLYIKVRAAELQFPAFNVARSLWMTNVTMQGNNAPGVQALNARREMIIADSSFVDWTPNRGSVVAATGPSASFLRTEFRRNTVTESGSMVTLDRFETIARFQQVTFANNTGDNSVKQRGGPKPCLNGDEPPAVVADFESSTSAGAPTSALEFSDYADQYDFDLTGFDESSAAGGGEDVFSDVPLTVARNCVPSGAASLPLQQATNRLVLFLTLQDESFTSLQQRSRTGTITRPSVVVLSGPPAFGAQCSTNSNSRGRRFGVSRDDFPDEDFGPAFDFGFFGVALSFLAFCLGPLCVLAKRRSLAVAPQQVGRNRGFAGFEAQASDGSDEDVQVPWKDEAAPKELIRVATHRWAAPKVVDEDTDAESGNEAKKVTAAGEEREAGSANVAGATSGSMERFHSVHSSTEVPVYIPPAAMSTVTEECEEATCSHCHHANEGDTATGSTDHEHGCACAHDHGVVTALAAVTAGSAAPQVDAAAAAAAPGNDDTSGIKDTACVICYENVGDHVLVPCGHGGYCRTCAQRMFSKGPRLCPICRAPVDTVVKVSLDTPVGESAPAALTRLLKKPEVEDESETSEASTAPEAPTAVV